MSSEDVLAESARRRALDTYSATTVLLLLGIGVLVVYSILLGPLTSPGAQQSFGYALALMALMGAALFHILDRTYRVWPLGRRYAPQAPGPVTVDAQVRFLKALVFALAAAAIAYLLAGLFT